MKVRELMRGEIFETLIDGAPSGNVYRVAGAASSHGGLMLCQRHATGERVRVHPDCECRKLDPEAF